MPLLLLAWGKSALGWLSGLSWRVWATVAALVLVAGVWYWAIPRFKPESLQP